MDFQLWGVSAPTLVLCEGQLYKSISREVLALLCAWKAHGTKPGAHSLQISDLSCLAGLALPQSHLPPGT